MANFVETTYVDAIVVGEELLTIVPDEPVPFEVSGITGPLARVVNL